MLLPQTPQLRYTNNMKTDSFTVHTLSGYIQSLYLIEYPTKLLLLDSGCFCDGVMVQQFIEDTLNRRFSDLQLVVVTHPHPDHAGGSSYFQQKGIPIAGVHNLHTWYSGVSGWLTQQVDILMTHFVAYKRKTPFKRIAFPRHITLDVILKIDEPIPDFPDWNVVNTPGHTTMDVSLCNDSASMMYIGDCIVYTGRRYITPYPLTDPTAYRNTLNTIESMGLSTLLMAHYGAKTISAETFDMLRSSIPELPRTHINMIKQKLGLL